MRKLSRREFAISGVSAALAALTATDILSVRSAAFGQGDLSFVNPELRAPLLQLLTNSSFPSTLSPTTLEANRNASESLARPPLAAPKFEKRLVRGPAGAPDVVVYLINAESGARKPAILHTHGGGFVTGSAKSGLAELQGIASSLDCVIATVDYRLAPETTFAGSMEDNYAGLSWLYHNGEEVGVDPKRIAVMGESAGGGHAALLALTARDRGEIPIIFQALIYPMLDDRTGTSLHPKSPIGSLIWTGDKNRFGWRSFLGHEPGTRDIPSRAVPARYDRLSGLPSAFIGVGSIDLFVDEDVEFARRLIDAGVPTELMVVPGAFHGFDGIAAQTSLAKDFTSAKLAALRRAFETAS